MNFLSRPQALATLIVMTLSLLAQMLFLPWLSLGLAVALLVVAWYHWLALWSVPNYVKFLGLLVAIVSLALQYGNFFGLEPMVGLFAFSMLLKLLEASRRRDVYLLLVLSLFGLATPLLFNQSLAWFAVVVILAILHLAMMTVLHSHVDRLFVFKPAMLILLQALPLALLLFFVVPRLPPIWSVPMPKHQATTGLSDRLQMGSFGELSRDTSLAFTATFEESVPLRSERYWRSLMLVDYDGREWRPMSPRENIALGGAIQQGRWDYQLLMPASYQRWLPVLGVAQQWPSNVVSFRDGTLQSKMKIATKQLISVQSEPENDRYITDEIRRRTLHLPAGVHLRTRALAHELGDGLAPDAQLQALLSYFSNEAFYYTLRPQSLFGDHVDSFMFETREGFCEHYAVAFAVMARELGLPARLATGYLGGEQSQVVEDSLSVYQYDAHAWVEVWLDALGWQRYDPTSWINPARIDATANYRPEWAAEDLSVIERWLWSARSQYWIMNARHYSEWLNIRWMQFMLSYDSQGQISFLRRWLGEVTTWKMLLLGGVVFLPWIFWWLFKFIRHNDKQIDPLFELYRELLGVLSMPLSTPPLELKVVLQTRYSQLNFSVLDDLNTIWFAGHAKDSAMLIAALKNLLVQLKKKPQIDNLSEA